MTKPIDELLININQFIYKLREEEKDLFASKNKILSLKEKYPDLSFDEDTGAQTSTFYSNLIVPELLTIKYFRNGVYNLSLSKIEMIDGHEYRIFKSSDVFAKESTNTLNFIKLAFQIPDNLYPQYKNQVIALLKTFKDFNWDIDYDNLDERIKNLIIFS